MFAPHAQMIAAFVVPLLWMASSTGLILLNKYLMMDKGAVRLSACFCSRVRSTVKKQGLCVSWRLDQVSISRRHQ